MTEQQQPLAVTLEEAARLTSLSIHTLRLYVREGRIKAVRAGRRVLVPMTEVQRIVTEGISVD